MDTAAEGRFDRLTRRAAKVLHAPVALVSLVDADRQFFKSCVGLPEPWSSLRETPLTPHFAHFARTHARWQGEELEDVVVALADNVWKGKRVEALESRVAELIAEQSGGEAWRVFCLLDTICEGVAAGGERRVAWQVSSAET